jgi:hypothetical protein
MTPRERVLLHQAHPAKLATDVATAAISLALLWSGRLAAALVVMWVPSIAVSVYLVRRGKLNEVRRSRLGRYVLEHMTPVMEALRLAGMVVMALGAWLHLAAELVAGLCMIVGGWLLGAVAPPARRRR